MMLDEPGADQSASVADCNKVILDGYDTGNFQRGAPAIVEAAWIVIQALFVSSFVPGSLHRRWLLRRFGAKIGHGVVVKPGVRIKFPWRLSVGDYTWIGENVWIDNLGEVSIGAHCCISQSAYICTGSHDWSSSSFDLFVRPIVIRDSAWIASHAKVAPGALVDNGVVLTLGSVASGQLRPWQIYQGNPAVSVSIRSINKTR